MTHPAADGLLSWELWQAALEKFGEATQLTLHLFDAEQRIAFGPIHPTPLLQLFGLTGYDPGLIAECARRCLSETEGPTVVISEFRGLAVVGASFLLDGQIVGAAVAGYAFVEFLQPTEIQRLARAARIGFERLWMIARRQAPVPRQRLRVHGELLQALGDTLLEEHWRTRQLAKQLADMQRLHELSHQLMRQDDPGLVLREFLRAAAALLGIEKGSVQICDVHSQALQIVDTIGFDLAFKEQFQTVDANGFTTCAAALRQRRRVIVEDIAADPDFTELAEVLRRYGIRAMQSTPLLDRQGAVVAMLTTYYDRPYRPSERELRLLDLYVELAARRIEVKRAEERQQLLINELNHRVKNTLAIVHSLAMQTLNESDTAAENRASFEARLVALAKAHDVLTQEHWESAGLSRVVTDAIAPYSGGEGEPRFRVGGPFVRLQPRAALALSMALHELATNALKYGALSNGAGRVEISWRVSAGDPPRFQLRWAESGGPPVEAPRRRGFGSRLIERGLAQDTGGQAQLDFAPGGLVCTIDAPLEEMSGA